jgi:prepilin-type N-terminal cleavage/methylation domain-containing protein
MHRRREAGFSFIEIMVVMAIITVLVSMVVVVIPRINEQANRTKSKDNLGTLVTMFLDEGPAVSSWPGVNGKAFTLWPVAAWKIDKRNLKNLEVLFSPGDRYYTLGNVPEGDWAEVTKNGLRDGTSNFARFTSYAGRRNKEKEFKITSDELSKGTMVLCDDDDGPLHHGKGLVAAYSNRRSDFLDWEALKIDPPENEKDPAGLLGDGAGNDELKQMSSGN